MHTLKHLTALEQAAADFGFQWETPEQILAQIQSECDEIAVHVKDGDRSKLQEEIGDLLHAAFSLCLFCQCDPEETLQASVLKFEDRLRAVKHLAEAAGLPHLKGKSFTELMEFWNRAKQVTAESYDQRKTSS